MYSFLSLVHAHYTCLHRGTLVHYNTKWLSLHCVKLHVSHTPYGLPTAPYTIQRPPESREVCGSALLSD